MIADGDRTPVSDVLVAVPACDEQDSIAACLDAVVVALHRAMTAGLVRRVRVAVAAHRCRDATAAVAGRVLRAAGVDHLVVTYLEPAPVGRVRSLLVERALAVATPMDLATTWLFSTDADSVVPPDWVTGLLTAAHRGGADLVAGLTTLTDWRVDDDTREAYDQLLAAGMTADGHQHVYAANLAVRAEPYVAVGGFPSSAHGEEHGLVAAVRAWGGTVRSVTEPRVATSARMPGRALLGLGALLRDLQVDPARPRSAAG